jgi:FHA domain
VGILEHAVTKARRSLAARSLLGRAPTNVIRIDDPRVSAEHASVFWSGAQWEVRDLGSSNGTMVDGRRLDRGGRAVLRQGSELRLAGGERWVLIDVLPPTATARSASGRTQIAESGLLILPRSSAPIACAYEDGNGVWWIEVGDETRFAIDQETIMAGEPWLLSIPPAVPQSAVSTTVKLERPLDLATVTLRFGVSSDEEHTEMWLVHEDGIKELNARAYTYLLLLLARARRRDREEGVAPSEEGWVYVEDMQKKLQTDPEKFNLMIFRARQHLSQLGLIDAGAVVQRRLGSRQIRLGTERFEIVPA